MEKRGALFHNRMVLSLSLSHFYLIINSNGKVQSIRILIYVYSHDSLLFKRYNDFVFVFDSIRWRLIYPFFNCARANWNQGPLRVSPIPRRHIEVTFVGESVQASGSTFFYSILITQWLGVRIISERVWEEWRIVDEYRSNRKYLTHQSHWVLISFSRNPVTHGWSRVPDTREWADAHLS